jgi:hypothetical protein
MTNERTVQQTWEVRRSPTVKIRTTNLKQTGWHVSPYAGVRQWQRK